MKSVGYTNRTRYWQVYAFNNPPEGYKYKLGKDLPCRYLGVKSRFLLNTKWMLPFQNHDLYHAYNSIVSAGKIPWVVEVESMVPRYGHLKEGNVRYNWGVRKLKSDLCRAIIFTSECTRAMNKENIDRWEIDPDKCHVIYRAVETHNRLQRTGEEKNFTILFVGNGFYRKGGVELLKAYKEFNRSDTRLVIISNFEVDWKIKPTEEDKKFVQNEIEENCNILTYRSLPHEEVINWMSKSDVFVNTTYADPFNNSIMEAMACQLPVIVSDVRAIPEYVKDEYNGFMMTPDLDDRDQMIDHILGALNKYYDDSVLLKEHGRRGLGIIESNFLIHHRNKKLKILYNTVTKK